MPDQGADAEPTYEQQVRREKLLLVRLSIMQGLVPPDERLRTAMSQDEWREYIVGLTPPSGTAPNNYSSESDLRTYFLRVREADKLQLRVSRTPSKRRGPAWHEMREKTRAAYLRAFNELREALRTSPHLEARLFPQPVYLPHSPLWPVRSDMPRTVRKPPSAPPSADAKTHYDFTKRYIDGLIGLAQSDAPLAE